MGDIFKRKYIFLVLWGLFQISLFLTGFFMQKLNPGLKTLNKLGYSVFTSRGAGLCLAVGPSLLLFPMCRHTITFLRKKIPILKNVLPEYSVYFHKLCSYTLLFWALVHTICHYINFQGVEYILKIKKATSLHFGMVGGITGHIMGLSLFVIFMTSFKCIRSLKYNVFWYFHHFFIIFFGAYILHGSGCFVKTDSGKCMPYYSFLVFFPVISIYMIERLIRECRRESVISSVIFSGEIVKIKMPDGYYSNKYSPGEYVLVKIPEISNYEWHPFTITSCPSDKNMEIVMRCLGDWTSNVRLLMLERISEKKELPKIKIDGPFGSPIDSICNYTAAILVASGIGITPYISMLKYIIKNNSLVNIKKLDLIWVNRDPRYFEWFNDEIKFFWENSCSTRINFHIYLTDSIKDTERIKSIVSGENVSMNKIYKTDIPINYGRPNFNIFFKNYIQNNVDLDVGCFVCGSKELQEVVKKTCDYYSNKDLTFSFKAEKFS